MLFLFGKSILHEFSIQYYYGPGMQASFIQAMISFLFSLSAVFKASHKNFKLPCGALNFKLDRMGADWQDDVW